LSQTCIAALDTEQTAGIVLAVGSLCIVPLVVFLACCDVSRLTGTVSRFLGYHEELLEVCGPSVGFSVVLLDHKSDERIVQKGDVIQPLGSPCRKQ